MQRGLRHRFGQGDGMGELHDHVPAWNYSSTLTPSPIPTSQHDSPITIMGTTLAGHECQHDVPHLPEPEPPLPLPPLPTHTQHDSPMTIMGTPWLAKSANMKFLICLNLSAMTPPSAPLSPSTPQFQLKLSLVPSLLPSPLLWVTHRVTVSG